MTRFESTLFRALALLPAAFSPALAEIFVIGNHKELFIDDRFVTENRGVEWQMNSPSKEGAVLTGTASWENGYLSAYGTVREDGGKYRLWYVALPAMANGLIDQSTSRLCYAESEDGMHWLKPELGLYEWQGSKANNILMEAGLENADVMIDPKAPPGARYKLIGRLKQRSQRWPNGSAPDGTGLYVYTSPDGLRWALNPHRVFPFDCDTLNLALYDERTDKYLAFVRTWNPLRRVGVVEMDDLVKPWPYDTTVPRPASGSALPMAPSRQIPDAFGTDRDDPPNLDFYTSAVVQYPWADDVYLMFPSAYRHFPDPPRGKFKNDGTLDIDLAVSRSGRLFHRVSRLPYLGLGLKGSGDDSALYLYIGMLRRNNLIYQYYQGYDFTHGSHAGFSETRHRGALFLARSRLDGFVSLDAGSEIGHFVTPPVIFRGRHLVLNMNASGTGEIRVELEDAGGKAIGIYDYDSDQGTPRGGYSFAECDPLYGNDVAKVVTWRRSDADLSHLAGQPVRLAFRMRLAKLFSFQFTD